MRIKDLLKRMVAVEASDLFYHVGGMPYLRINGDVLTLEAGVVKLNDMISAIEELTTTDQRNAFKKNLDLDFAYYFEEIDRRFRINLLMQNNTPAIVIRNVRGDIPGFEELNLPAGILKKLSMEKRGLVLLTGSTGSGKSTAIASMIEYINNNAKKHILTIEEPIEFTFKDKNCIINQREIDVDVTSYASALHAFALQSPDVIFINNIRDYETMSAALTAADTGVLVLSTLHTINASQTVERIINFFPPHHNQQIRTQLSYLLKGVISLRLLPSKNGAERIPAYETMILAPSISRLIRENNILDMPKFIEDGNSYGMQSFNQSLIKLIQKGKITKNIAEQFSDNKDELAVALGKLKL